MTCDPFFVSQILNPYIPAIVLCVMGFCFVSSQIVCLSVSLSFSLSVKPFFFPLSSSLVGGSGPGQDGEWRGNPGRETP